MLKIGKSLQGDRSEVRTDDQACTDLNTSHATQVRKLNGDLQLFDRMLAPLTPTAYISTLCRSMERQLWSCILILQAITSCLHYHTKNLQVSRQNKILQLSHSCSCYLQLCLQHCTWLYTHYRPSFVCAQSSVSLPVNSIQLLSCPSVAQLLIHAAHSVHQTSSHELLPTGSSPSTHAERAVDSHPSQTLSAHATQTAPGPTTLPEAELQKCSLTNPSAPSLPQKCQAPTDLVTVSMNDPTRVPPPLPKVGPQLQPAPGSLAIGLVQPPDADTTLASSVASAAAHPSVQTAGQAAGSTRGNPTAQALPPPSDQFSAPDMASMDSFMKEHASKPSSHDTVDHPASASLAAPTGKQAADPIPYQTCHQAAEPTGGSAPTLPHAQASDPPGTGSPPLDPTPNIPADDPAGSGLSAPSADQQLPTGKPSEPPPPMVATTGGVAPVVATAVAAIRTRPKRVSRSREATTSVDALATGAKRAAASCASVVPAALLTTGTTDSGKGRGVELVGQRIEVWWSGNKEFFAGTVKAYTSKVLLPMKSALSCHL